MPISVKPLVDQINARFSSSLASTSTNKLTQAAAALTTAVKCVASETDLPLASENTGTFVYVDSICNYRYSNGVDWDNTYIPYYYDIWAWGYNNFTGQGALGDNSTINKSSPVSVIGGFIDWCCVSVGTITAALRSNGTAWGWGCNGQGQIGDSTTIARSSPVSTVGGFTNWSQISTGAPHTLALRKDGTIWAWGGNPQGNIGDNTVVNRSSPVSVIGGITDWCKIYAGLYHSMALRSNGTLWAWGRNTNGHLGDSTVVNRSSPVSVIGGFADWCQFSAGYHSVAIRTNGELWAWGQGTGGKLGDNNTVNRSSPVSIVGGFTNWCNVSAGQNHTAAIRTNGELWTWGCGTNGFLGDNSTINKSSPVSVVGGFTDWCSVSLGRYHTLALKTNGTTWAWGRNNTGHLGDGTTISKSSPVSVVGGFTWYQISANRSSAGIRIYC